MEGEAGCAISERKLVRIPLSSRLEIFLAYKNLSAKCLKIIALVKAAYL